MPWFVCRQDCFDGTNCRKYSRGGEPVELPEDSPVAKYFDQVPTPPEVLAREEGARLRREALEKEEEEIDEGTEED